jgi:hypothetical protein
VAALRGCWAFPGSRDVSLTSALGGASRLQFSLSPRSNQWLVSGACSCRAARLFGEYEVATGDDFEATALVEIGYRF